MSKALLKALKAVNSISRNSVTDENLNLRRLAIDKAGELAAPDKNCEIVEFNVGEIPCEWVKPKRKGNCDRVVLYAHGGGYTCGGLGYARILATKITLATGFPTVSFAYRLAPENKYPAAFEDTKALWDRLVNEGVRAEKIILAGDSAGGNLMLCLTQLLLSDGKARPGALLLFSPWTDMTANSISYEIYADRDPILTREFVTGVRDAYIGTGRDINPADPKYSPLFGNFTGFPPTVIMAGRNEILLDDSEKLYKALKESGVNAILDIEEEGWHVYPQMPLPIAHRAMNRLTGYMAELLDCDFLFSFQGNL